MRIHDFREIGNRLYAVRKRLGLTQMEVAERAGTRALRSGRRSSLPALRPARKRTGTRRCGCWRSTSSPWIKTRFRVDRANALRYR